MNGGVHSTDVTNASRTMLMNIETLKWDPVLLSFFDIPSEILPQIRSSSEIYGHIQEGSLKGVPISGVLFLSCISITNQRISILIVSTKKNYDLITEIFFSQCLGDQQSALVGQMCLQQGQAKSTYGTGCFLLYNTGSAVKSFLLFNFEVWSKNGLLLFHLQNQRK